ncbi:alpha-mannosidase [Parabacteroides sp. FAFU027]|uniref:alpha-mannosidase n=1 Tax=Parabacteroides sp. FAFU027 TaxID=2922715 RepID=UPI001FB026CF|nr:glycoside hydrolase family 38 C-terminal domain-containing protein [Parabacteroides sp. FAFU027]
MKLLFSLIALGMTTIQLATAQAPQKPEKYDIAKDRLLYTIGYAHLDSEWNWDYPFTINQCIRNTMEENFRLFEKYPDYVFNFTGSRRYNMMKEYYPEQFKKVVDYVHKGRWHVSGSSVDEGEVNISSSESLIRQILYGNNFFRREFAKESADYMLPDCFGFLYNLPTVFHHCGLLGFSTQKLTWHSAAGVPFNVGVWNGPDGKGVVAALNASNYTGRVEERLDKNPGWISRLDDNFKKTGYAFDFRYYGVGDQGGSPRENDVKHAEKSLNNRDSNFKVLLTSSDQMFKDITPEIRKALPTYSGDLLLIEHSAGSMTSQAYMKRANRKNELLAQSAEQVSVMADWMKAAEYPLQKINSAWDLVLGSQFHDILPGTSIPKAYEYAWNDEFVASNGFAEILKHGVSAIAGSMNTLTAGKAVVIYNPVAHSREDVVTAELEYPAMPAHVAVFDHNGLEVSSQVISRAGNKLTLLFLAQVPPVGMAVYDVREVAAARTGKSLLSATNRTLENSYYKVEFATNGDILSIRDKKANKELLSAPARLEFQQERPVEWPAWNMDWADRKKAPVDFMDKDAELTVVENGPVRVTLQVKRKGRNSEIVQLFSLSASEAGKRLEVSNKIDWQSREVSLKASFPLAVNNEKATYNLGVGTIARGNNNEKMFEVPFKEWMDLTDKSGRYGVSILEDCKYGADKPNDNTLRLTLLYTPGAKAFNGAYMYQSTQDWGIHDVKYAIYGHEGGWQDAGPAWQAKFFNQPLIAFESPKHAGVQGKTFSMISIDNPKVGVMACKKMEQGDYYLVRVNELAGEDQKSVRLSLPGKIINAYEVNGQEQKTGNATVHDGKLTFDLSHYTIRSFAVQLEGQAVQKNGMNQQSVDLPYDADVVSFDGNRDDGDFVYKQTLPGELLPESVQSEDIRFVLGGKNDGQNNAVSCNGQKIQLPQGNYTRIYLLAAATEDTKGDFLIDGQVKPLDIQEWTGYVGQFYNRVLSRDRNSVVEMQKPFTKRDNIAWYASHVHNAYPSSNEAYQYCYLYKYEVEIPAGAKELVLPVNNRIKLMAVTLAAPAIGNVTPLQPLYDDFAGHPEFKLREK